jgi:hypothetical protein
MNFSDDISDEHDIDHQNGSFPLLGEPALSLVNHSSASVGEVHPATLMLASRAKSPPRSLAMGTLVNRGACAGNRSPQSARNTRTQRQVKEQ